MPIRSDHRDGSDNERGQNSERMDPEFRIDFRLTKRFTLNGAASVYVMLDMFNLFNQTNFTEVNNIFGPGAFPQAPAAGRRRTRHLRTLREGRSAAPVPARRPTELLVIDHHWIEQEMPDVAPEPFSGIDRFTVTRRIGHGSMGVVYEARDLARQMTVAVKTIRGGDRARSTDSSGSSDRCRTSRIATSRCCTNLLRRATPWFFTMELVNGVTFLEHVRRSASVDYARLSAALEELAAGPDRAPFSQKAPSRHQAVQRPRRTERPGGRARLRPRDRFEGPRLGRFPNTTRSARSQTHGAGTGFPGDALTEAADWDSVGTLVFQALTGKLPSKAIRRRSSGCQACR